MRIFKGHPKNLDYGGPCLVTVVRSDGSEAVLDPRNDLRNHSPDGFQWGYGGSGPAQLALAMCTYILGDDEGQRVYQDYKFAIIARLPQGMGWEISEEDLKRDIKLIFEQGSK